MTFRRRILRFARKLHIVVGLTAALYFMLIAGTGVAINHRERLHLDEHAVGRKWLPTSYRPEDGPEVRSDIVVTDLHSGLIFGKVGAPVLDLVAIVWFLSIVSGITMLALRRSLHYSQSKVVYTDALARVAVPPSAAEAAGKTEIVESRRSGK